MKNYHRVVTLFFDVEIGANLYIDTNVTLKLIIHTLYMNYTTYDDSYIEKLKNKWDYGELW